MIFVIKVRNRLEHHCDRVGGEWVQNRVNTDCRRIEFTKVFLKTVQDKLNFDKIQ